MRFLSLAFVPSCLLLAAAAASGQGVGSSGSISGTVSDPSGAFVHQATVTAADRARGTRVTTSTDDLGHYQFNGLSPALYDVTVQAAGFESVVQKGITVAIGENTAIDFHLTVSRATEIVEVKSEPPVVDTIRSSQSNSVNDQLITDLPINRRDYLTFSLLMPGVSNSNTIADNSDFRVKQTPQSGLSFYGSNGRGNSVTVDGGEANDDAGGVRLTLSQDAVQEFQINRSNYTAELGSASGASINIVSKSGGNSFHGGVFGFFRNDAMDARDHFAYSQALEPGSTFSLTAAGQPIKDSLSRQQFGASLGGAIVKDKTFFFVAYEGLRADAQDSVPLLTSSSIFAPTSSQLPILGGLAALGTTPVPCFTGMAAIPALYCAGALQNILTINPAAGPLDAFIVNQFEKDGGLFPYQTRQQEGSVRIDQVFSATDQAFLRYSAANLSEQDPDLQALTGYSRGSSLLDWDSTAQASWFHSFSPSTQNEARAQWNVYRFNVTTNDPGGPGLDVGGYGYFGRNIFLPSYTIAHREEIADNFVLVHGNHSFRAGFDETLRGNNTTSDTFFAGRFEFLDLPGGLVSPCLQVPAACGLPVSTPSASLSSLQALSLGLPAFYEQGFGNPRWSALRPLTAFYGQDSWKIRPNFVLNYGVRYELDSQGGIIRTSKLNFAPRISFAWDPFNTHKTAIRAGYGMFYSPIYAQIANVVATLGNNNGNRQIANTLVSILGVPGNPNLNSALIFQTLFAEGKIGCGAAAGGNACIAQSDLAQFGLNISNSGALPPGTVLFSAAPNYRNPYAQQGSFQIEHEVGAGFSISASYIFVHTIRLPWAIDTNLLPGAPAVTGLGANGLPTNGQPFQDWGAPACDAIPPAPNPCFADPTRTILQNNVYSSLASAIYHGGIFELKKRFSDNLSVMANYTYSKAIDNSTDFNSDYAPANQADLAGERAVSNFDQRHKVVLAGVLASPWHSPVLRGFQLSPIFTYNSGHPFNLLAGADINGDNHFTNDRPPGDGRNTGLGPDLYQLDCRLSRDFRIREGTALTLLAEGFNIANRTNYASVNNVVGAAYGPPFNAQGSAALSPSQPLGFTSDFPKRQIQLGIRLSF